jgi:hypothetical protein
MPFYKNIRTHCKVDEVMKDKNWSHITLLVQLRSNIPRISVKNKHVSFNYINTNFGQTSVDSKDKCILCSLNSSETIFHVLFRCPAYAIIRQSELVLDHYPTSTEEYFTWKNMLTKAELRKVYVYFDKMLEAREEGIDELTWN